VVGQELSLGLEEKSPEDGRGFFVGDSSWLLMGDGWRQRCRKRLVVSQGELLGGGEADNADVAGSGLWSQMRMMRPGWPVLKGGMVWV